MKILLKISTIFLTILFLACFSSCRSEFDEEIFNNSNENETLRLDSKSIKLLSRTAINNGSLDNVLDGSNCFNIKLPVTINIDDISINVISEDDFELVEEALNESDDDLNFEYPITLITNDFTEIIIEDETELQDTIESCTEDENDDIQCVDFKYPFSMSVFNTNSELLKEFTFNNDNQLYKFIKNLNKNDIINIEFPITLIISDNSEIVINTIKELENTIETTDNDCDTDEVNLNNLKQTIISEPYTIQKFKEGSNNQTIIFKDYVFNFSENDTIEVTINTNNETNTILGTWSIDINAENMLKINIDFGDDELLKKLSNNWTVKKIIEKRIMLYKKNNNQANSKDDLFFKRLD